MIGWLSIVKQVNIVPNATKTTAPSGEAFMLMKRDLLKNAFILVRTIHR